MREFGQDYLFRVSVEPVGGYRSFEKRRKPYYIVAQSKEAATQIVNEKLKSGWVVKVVSKLATQYSGAIFGPE